MVHFVYFYVYSLNIIKIVIVNPIQSWGGGFKSPPPAPQNFCPHAFNFGATLLCVGDFKKKNSLTPCCQQKNFDWGS